LYGRHAAMYPRAFQYFVPDSIEEAIRILSSCSDEAKLVGRMPEPDSG
jgi:hypothetical protein